MENIMDFVDSFKCLRPLKVGSKTYAYFSLPAAEKSGLKGISRLPFSLKVLLENLLRNEDGRSVIKEDIQAVAQWLKNRTSDREIAFRPARVLMQDFTGVPAVVDLAAMRDAMEHLGGDPKKINRWQSTSSAIATRSNAMSRKNTNRTRNVTDS
jgi:aconitate hydratase